MAVSPDTKAIVAALELLAKEIKKFQNEASKVARSLDVIAKELNKKDNGDDTPST